MNKYVQLNKFQLKTQINIINLHLLLLIVVIKETNVGIFWLARE